MPNRDYAAAVLDTEAYMLRIQVRRILQHLPLSDRRLQSAGYRGLLQGLAGASELRRTGRRSAMRNSSAESRFRTAHQGGWFDIFLAGTINGYTGMRAHAGSRDSPSRDTDDIGPWGHVQAAVWGRRFRRKANFSCPISDGLVRSTIYKGIDNGMRSRPPVRIFYWARMFGRTKQDWPIPGEIHSPLLGGRIKPRSGVRSAGEHKLNFSPPQRSASDSLSCTILSRPCQRSVGNNCCGTPIGWTQGPGPLEERPISWSNQRSPHRLWPSPDRDNEVVRITDGRDTD